MWIVRYFFGSVRSMTASSEAFFQQGVEVVVGVLVGDELAHGAFAAVYAGQHGVQLGNGVVQLIGHGLVLEKQTHGPFAGIDLGQQAVCAGEGLIEIVVEGVVREEFAGSAFAGIEVRREGVEAAPRR